MSSNHHLGQLNVFQRAMLQWNDLHPYHAVHVMRLEGPVDLRRLQNTLEACLRNRGLMGLRMDRAAGTYSYDCDAIPLPIREVCPQDEPDKALRDEIQRQLNERFPSTERFSPFRFFIMPDAGSFWVGMAYFHPVADAESVTRLMRDLASAYQTGQLPELSQPLNCHPERPERMLIRRYKLIARKVLALPRNILTMRHSHRPPLRVPHDQSSRLLLIPDSSNHLHRLITTARRWGVTLHDLMLAMLMKALAPLALDRHRDAKRRNLSLGTIANIRPDLGIDSEHTFGLFLGSFVVTHPVPEDITLQQLALELHSQTHRIKNRKLYLAAHLDLFLASRVLALHSTLRQGRFYHKHHPLWGGITNMNLNKLWPVDSGPKPLDYVRAVSTGPVTPLVLSITTLHDRLNISLTYRPAVFTEGGIAQVREGLTRELNQVEESV